MHQLQSAVRLAVSPQGFDESALPIANEELPVMRWESRLRPHFSGPGVLRARIRTTPRSSNLGLYLDQATARPGNSRRAAGDLIGLAFLVRSPGVDGVSDGLPAIACPPKMMRVVRELTGISVWWKTLKQMGGRKRGDHPVALQSE